MIEPIKAFVQEFITTLLSLAILAWIMAKALAILPTGMAVLCVLVVAKLVGF